MLTAIIVAGGSGRRAGFDKTFALLGGEAVLAHSIRAFADCDFVSRIVVVGRAERLDEIRKISAAKSFEVVAGGAQRQDSVWAGLECLSDDCDFVAVHDAARPLITPAQIERTFAAAKIHGAAALAAQVTDTLKRADKQRFARESVVRENLFAMQTPQIFATKLLRRAYEAVQKNRLAITDEVSAVQQVGEKVAIVPNAEQNLKITFPNDLSLAEFILSQRARK